MMDGLINSSCHYEDVLRVVLAGDNNGYSQHLQRERDLDTFKLPSEVIANPESRLFSTRDRISKRVGFTGKTPL